jgi:hypothetical protein
MRCMLMPWHRAAHTWRPCTDAVGDAAAAGACRYRLCVEESNALGVLGEHGRGACEAAGLLPGQVRLRGCCA